MLGFFILTTIIVFVVFGIIVAIAASFYPEFKDKKNNYIVNEDLIISPFGKEYRILYSWVAKTIKARVFQGDKKWFIRNVGFFPNDLDRLLSFFRNNDEIDFSNFKINKDNATIKDKTITWTYITYMPGFSFSTYETKNILTIEFDRLTKLYSIRFIDLTYEIILEVINFETQEEVETFLNNSYKFYLQEKKKQEELDKKKKLEEEEILNSLP